MEEKKIIINGHEAVDLGLSVKWATCNIGANNPEELGEKYHWGEIEPPTEKSKFYDEEKGFVDHTIIGLHYQQGYKRSRYKVGGITRSIIIYDISGSDMYDVARHKWGAKWRMPRVAEVEELIDECTWEPVKIGELCVCKITGKNGNSIFLPTDEEFYGHFYTSQYRIDTWDDEYGCDGECYLSCHSGCSYVNVTGGHGAAMPIRPVIGNEDGIPMFQQSIP